MRRSQLDAWIIICTFKELDKVYKFTNDEYEGEPSSSNNKCGPFKTDGNGCLVFENRKIKQSKI